MSSNRERDRQGERQTRKERGEKSEKRQRGSRGRVERGVHPLGTCELTKCAFMRAQLDCALHNEKKVKNNCKKTIGTSSTNIAAN